MKFDFDDILIVPSEITDINSRSEIKIHDEYGYLPIFTAPMDTVVNRQNAHHFTHNGIRVVLPREKMDDLSGGYYSTSDGCWYSYSLSDFKAVFLDSTCVETKYMFALIDVANGHMPAVRDTIHAAKIKYGARLQIMVGNIANPETFRILSDAGADYIRVGIGNGGGCLTTQQTGIGYPMASLIRETYEVSCTLRNSAMIVADGGFKKYSDIIKALALGADYVMLGSIFNKALESAGENMVKPGDHHPMTISTYKEACYANMIPGDPNESLEDMMHYGKLYKRFRGMSTKEVQRSLGCDNLKTSEGIVKYQQVEYSLSGWVENFEHYLKSAMSYTNAHFLSEFIGEVKTIEVSQNSFNRYNK